MNMSMRSSLLIAIEQQVRGWNVTQAEAARRLGVTQPRLNDLLRGRITNFSLDALINLAGAAGLTVRLQIADAA
jgi:predicted XRE-type DNA-binding protein